MRRFQRLTRIFVLLASCVSVAMAVAAQDRRAQGEGLLERAFSGKARVIELSHDLSADTHRRQAA